jgi:ubiquinol-cytochrome c reductase cytochrome b subunit
MRILKTNPVLTIFNSYLVDSPQPSSISYLYNFGSLLGLSLVVQIITGIFLAMHFAGTAELAFSSAEHIMRDVNDGWLLRYTHGNMASFFFVAVYLHIARGLYYGSYRSPRIGVWVIGTIIFFLMMATAFLGYVLPYGQMSLWGATVITNLLSAIPWLGKSLVEFVWGGFSVSSATINRFFSLHFTLPFILAALVAGHLLYLHISGSSNPVGTTGNADRTAFHPYFSFKDLVTVYLFLFAFALIIFYAPDKLGHSDNYIEANSMQTPPSIVPEWYLLPFYAILRSIPNKLLGVISMFVAILILLILPFVDTSNIKGSSFKPLFIVAFWIFALNFLVLMWLGSCHVEPPFIVAGQIATAYYFAHFLIIIPVFGIIDNVLSMIAISSHGLTHKEAKVEKIKVEEGEMTKEENIKTKEDDELYEFIYSVQNHTFSHVR